MTHLPHYQISDTISGDVRGGRPGWSRDGELGQVHVQNSQLHKFFVGHSRCKYVLHDALDW